MSGSGEKILEVDNISCHYEGIRAIESATLYVNRGEIAAIIGANGAGKSTLMKSIAGLLRPESGRITFEGEDITGSPANRIIYKGISYVPEGRRLFANLTVRENLELGAFKERERSVIEGRLEEVFALFPILKERELQLAQTMSGGEQQMCAIARGLMSAPKLLMLDELSLGLMPSLVEKVLESVVEINKKGVTILLVEQMVQEALEISSRGYVIKVGRIVRSGSAKELLESDEVRKAYMGI
ncbi:MAG: ABC transporter ATP-binding protein [Synergistaceae bacterium]|jgi:branched-chain amino acid transport system ATP-binding protein|nr:ABC transporter ATP-binding protein [Synergistaceae bacterium]